MSEHKKCSAVKLLIIAGKPTVVRCAVPREPHRPWHDGQHEALGQKWD